ELEAHPGHVRLLSRHDAGLRSRRQVPVLPLEPHLPSVVQRSRQHVDLREHEQRRGRAVAQGRRLAARVPQRRRRREGRGQGQGRRQGRRLVRWRGREGRRGRQGQERDRQEGQAQGRQGQGRQGRRQGRVRQGEGQGRQEEE